MMRGLRRIGYSFSPGETKCFRCYSKVFWRMFRKNSPWDSDQTHWAIPRVSPGRIRLNSL